MQMSRGFKSTIFRFARQCQQKTLLETRERSVAFLASISTSRPISQTSGFFGFGRMSGEELQKNVERAARAIVEAKAILITSGAGMGVDSGLPDFRGPEGFWKAYPPIKKRGLTLPEVSTPRWFIEDPEFAWGFFGHRMNLYKSTKPHKGFQILKTWVESKSDDYFVYTSNVDGHFQKAGFPEEKVVECHGSLNFLQSINGDGKVWPVPEDMVIDVDDSTLKAKLPLPMGPPGIKRFWSWKLATTTIHFLYTSY